MSRVATEAVDHITIEDPDVDLDALGGDDTVVVLANRAVARGGAGDDWLTATLFGDFDSVQEGAEDTDGDGEPDSFPNALLTAELHGDDGDDRLHAMIRSYEWEGPSITVSLHGGRGDDILWIDLVASGGVLTSFVDAGSGNDTIRVSALTDSLRYGAGGPIEIDAGDGDDDIVVYADGGGTEFMSMAATATIRGGAGDDRIEVYQTSSAWDSGGSLNDIRGGDGADEIIATAAGGADWGDTANHIRGGRGDDAITATALAEAGVTATTLNDVQGGAGDDRMTLIGAAGPRSAPEGIDGTNRASGGSGDDVITARLLLTGDEGENRGFNELRGDAGDDRLTAVISIPDAELGKARSELHGGSGDDRLKVSGGTGNLLYGNQGDDTLLGSANDDRLIGGQGADYLRGYGGSDVFVFMGARGTGASERDRIADFTIGADLIDVSAIDAKSWRPGNQSFTFDAQGEGRSGTLWVEENPDNHGSILYANTGRALLAVNLLDGRGVHADDYSASDFIL